MIGDPHRGRRDGRGARAAGMAGLLLAALTAAAAIWLSRPPVPPAAAAAPERFSAGRALADVEVLAAGPRPIGSAAHRRAEEYLVGRMAELGLAPEVHEATAVRRTGESIRAARVRNLVGRRAGSDAGGALLLVAHYDSRPNAPGAGDDAAGVAVVLETVRALSRREPRGPELIVLLSDAEELGLLGASAFAAEHPWMEEVGAVLNFEARGSRGPAVMFETGVGDLEIVRRFAAAPHPLASSLSSEIYARMPNDTDFTVFRAAGRSGLNFAFVGDLAAYHSALDTVARLDPASLQQMGANALAVARGLAEGAPPGRGREGLYFNPLGHLFVVLPAGRALPLALAGAAAVLFLVVLGLRRRRIAAAGLRSGALKALGVPLLAPLAAALVWKLLADSASGVLDTPHRLPQRLELAGLALVLCGIAAAAALVAQGRRLESGEAALGVAGVWAALAVLTAAWLPGASFLFIWPLWGLLPGAALVIAADPRPAAATLILTLAALPGVALLAPLALLVFQALTPHQAAAATALALLAAGLVLPALAAAAGGRQLLAGAALIAGLAVLAAAVWGAPTSERPRVADLVRVEDLDEGSAWWVTRDPRPHSWVAARLGAAPESWQPPAHLGLGDGPVLRGAASGAGVAGAKVTVVEDVRDGDRRLKLRIGSPAGAPLLRLEALSTVQITAMELAGRRFERAGDEAARPLRLELAGFPPSGVEVTFELAGRWPLELRVSEQFYGLSDVPPLPSGLIPRTSWTSHSRLVHRSFLR